MSNGVAQPSLKAKAEGLLSSSGSSPKTVATVSRSAAHAPLGLFASAIGARLKLGFTYEFFISVLPPKNPNCRLPRNLRKVQNEFDNLIEYSDNAVNKAQIGSAAVAAVTGGRKNYIGAVTRFVGTWTCKA